MVEQRLADLNLKSIFPANGFFPWPIAWEDQIGGGIRGDVKPGSYTISIMQRSPDGQPTGGLSVQLKIEK